MQRQARSGPMGHGDTVEVYGATSKDRGYYVARLDYPGGREAFFLRNPEAKLRINPLKKWRKGEKNVAAGSVVIYQHADYKGRSSSFKPGRHNIGALGIGNDELTSLRVPKGRKVRLYEHANFKGRSMEVTRDMRYVGKSWNDRVSSLIID